MTIDWPTKDSITQTLVTNIIGPGKTISDLSNQWFTKHLIVALREAIYLLVVVIKSVYDQITALGAKGDKLDEEGFECGVDRKQATKAVHIVTLRKSSAVPANLPVPDNFLLTTTPLGNAPPIQFRVKSGQGKYIAAGQASIVGVQVECTQVGEVGNVPSGAINLVAQAGFDSVTDSALVESGQEKEDDEVYRVRILERKRNPERGGAPIDYKIWAESVEGVVSATVFPRSRGNGTVDILVTGSDGIPSQTLIDQIQAHINTKTPADIADGGVLVIAPTAVIIDVTLTGCLWRDGYTPASGGQIVDNALKDYISIRANIDRVVRVVDLITTAKGAYDAVDPDKNNVLIDFNITAPAVNQDLTNTEMSVPGTITLS